MTSGGAGTDRLRRRLAQLLRGPQSCFFWWKFFPVPPKGTARSARAARL